MHVWPHAGQAEGRYGNLTWNDTTAFLDRCAAIGIRVLFDFSQNAMKPPACWRVDNRTGKLAKCSALGMEVPPPPLDVIRDAVKRYRDHPAILSWYLIDEPDGNKCVWQPVNDSASTYN